MRLQGTGLSLEADTEPTVKEIDNKVLLSLKDRHGPLPLYGDAARMKAGHAPVVEKNAGAGGVEPIDEKGYALGVNLLHWGADEGENEIYVMDHDVEDYVDIDRAVGEWAEAVRLYVYGVGNLRECGLKCRIEPFEVAHLQDETLLSCQGYELLGLIGIGSNRFFDKNVGPRMKKGPADLKMGLRGTRDDDRLGNA